MNVLFITRGWPTPSDPMSGNYEAVQAKALVRKGVNVTVFNFKWKSLLHVFDRKKFNNFEEDGVKVFQAEMVIPVIPHVLDSFELQRKGKRKALLKFYKKYLQKNPTVDIVHAHSAFEAYIASVLKEKYHMPFVITEHWSKMNSDFIGEEEKRMGEGYVDADQVISVSDQLASSLKSKFGIDCIVIHNMVSDHFFDGELHQRISDQISFVSVGALNKGKGYDILIKAFADVDNDTNITLRIIGSGPEESKLRQLIEENQLHNRVYLLGRKKPDEVSSIIADSDCFILTSRGETFGIVYIEAMAKGKPVIATKCGGPEGFVNDSNGLLIPKEDIPAATKAIEYMVEHVKEYDAKKIRQDCYENFSENVIANRIIGVYNQVLQKS